jgi:N-succinyldiaminopimelate aminotransferase
VVVFHSLSKRSSVPGLRSGFVAGDPRLIEGFRRLRSFGGATVPLPVMAAAAALWRDDDHVEQNRALYRAKFDLAERVLGNRFGFFRPEGGFFLWLEVGDGEECARDLWANSALRVLPGAYLAQPEASGVNPGAPFVRVALIEDLASTEEALRRLVKTL